MVRTSRAASAFGASPVRSSVDTDRVVSVTSLPKVSPNAMNSGVISRRAPMLVSATPSRFCFTDTSAEFTSSIPAPQICEYRSAATVPYWPA